jgi:hypothetical protein
MLGQYTLVVVAVAMNATPDLDREWTPLLWRIASQHPGAKPQSHSGRHAVMRIEGRQSTTSQ